MARLWHCGFESNDLVNGSDFSIGSGGSIQGTTVHGGSYALEIKSLVSGSRQYVYQQFISSGGGPYYARFYFRCHTVPNAGNTIACLGNNTSSGIMIVLNNARTISLLDASSNVIGTSSALTADTWYRVEMLVDGSQTSGSCVVTALLDGTQFATSSNRTSTQCPNTCRNIYLGGNMASEAQTAGDWFFDDVAVNDNTGSYQNTYPGAGAIVHLHPNAAGDNNAFATAVGGTAGAANNYTRVNEVTPNSATSYNADNTSGHTDDFKCAATPAEIGSGDTINAVAVCAVAMGAGSPVATIQLRCKKAVAGTVASSIANSSYAGWYSYMFGSGVGGGGQGVVLYNDPDGTAWTKSTLDTMQIGYTVAVGNTYAVRVTNVWASIDHAAATSTPYTQTGTGAFTLAGTPQKSIAAPISGALALAGTLADHFVGSRLFTAALTVHDLFQRAVTRILPSGVLTFAGTAATSHGSSKALSGVLTLAGALGPRSVTRAAVAGLQLAGTIGRAMTRILPAGVLTFAGTASRQATRKLTAALSLAGTLGPRSITRALLGVLTLTGTAATLHGFYRTLTGALTLAGSIVKGTARTLSGGITLTGTAATIRSRYTALTGALTLAGTASRQTAHLLTGILTLAGSAKKSLTRGLTGGMTLAGTLQRSTVRILTAATLAFAGTVRKSTTRIMTGALSFAGALGPRSIGRSLSGAFTLVGSATKATVRILPAGAVQLAGTLQKSTKRILTAATLVLAGTIATVKNSGSHAYTQTLTAVLTLAGTAQKATARILPTAALHFAGTVTKQYGKTIVAILTLNGTLGPRNLTRIFTAALQLTGSRTIAATRSLSGTLTLIGHVSKGAGKQASGTLVIAGAMLRNTIQALAAQLALAGTQSKQTKHTQAGTLTAAGAMQRQTARSVTAVLTLVGTGLASRLRFVNLAATIGLTGSIGRGIARSLQAVLSAVGSFITTLTKKNPARVAVSDAIVTRLSVSDAMARSASHLLA